MKLVAESLVNVKRARREMERAFEAGDWDAVKRWDAKVGEGLNRAFDDSGRDNLGLVEELEKILGLYAHIVMGLPEQTTQNWLTKPASDECVPEARKNSFLT